MIQDEPEATPGHPVHTYMSENRHAQRLIDILKENPKDESTLTESGKM